MHAGIFTSLSSTVAHVGKLSSAGPIHLIHLLVFLFVAPLINYYCTVVPSFMTFIILFAQFTNGSFSIVPEHITCSWPCQGLDSSEVDCI